MSEPTWSEFHDRVAGRPPHATVSSLRPGGRFSGQLFGDREEWAGERDMTFLTRGEIERP